MNYIFANNIPTDSIENQPTIIFIFDHWDDYQCKTTFRASLLDQNDIISLGSVHISSLIQTSIDTKGFSMLDFIESHNMTNKILKGFPQDTILLGDLDYYTKLMTDFPKYVPKIFEDTNDIAFDTAQYGRAKDNEIVRTSFLRFTNENTILGQFHRIATGGKEKINSSFKITFQSNNSKNFDSSQEIHLRADPNAILPANVFALIGNNGIGKTSLLQDILVAASDLNHAISSKFMQEDSITFSSEETQGTQRKISNVVYISYSSFDYYDERFENTVHQSSKNNIFFLSNRDKNNINAVLPPDQVGHNIEEDLESIFEQEKMVQILKNNFQWDPDLDNFIEKAQVISSDPFTDYEKTDLQALAEKLSSGQKIVLSIVTSLINYSAENGLFIIDEPEAYLHAPYVLSIISTINDIVTAKNSIALIATHSPIVIQEIPRKNVFHIVEQNGNKFFQNPITETFGTDIQIISNEIFGLDTRNTGFYRILRDLALNSPQKIQELKEKDLLGTDALIYLSIFEESN